MRRLFKFPPVSDPSVFIERALKLRVSNGPLSLSPHTNHTSNINRKPLTPFDNNSSNNHNNNNNSNNNTSVLPSLFTAPPHQVLDKVLLVLVS